MNRMIGTDVAPALSLAQRYEQIVLDNPIEQLLDWAKEPELYEVKDIEDVLLLIVFVVKTKCKVSIHPHRSSEQPISCPKPSDLMTTKQIEGLLEYFEQCKKRGAIYVFKQGEQK